MNKLSILSVLLKQDKLNAFLRNSWNCNFLECLLECLLGWIWGFKLSVKTCCLIAKLPNIFHRNWANQLCWFGNYNFTNFVLHQFDFSSAALKNSKLLHVLSFNNCVLVLYFARLPRRRLKTELTDPGGRVSIWRPATDRRQSANIYSPRLKETRQAYF